MDEMFQQKKTAVLEGEEGDNLDKIFLNRLNKKSSYEEVILKLFASIASATLNEELRLVASVIDVSKSTPKESSQSPEIAGRICTIIADCYALLAISAIYRNPKYWSTKFTLESQKVSASSLK